MKPLIKSKLPGARAREAISRCANVYSPEDAQEYALVQERAEGVNIWDVDGNRFLDFNSGIAVMNFGHSNPKISSAIRAQLDKMSHTAWHDFYAETPLRFAEEFLSILPKGLNKIFLSNSGTESVECALKLSRRHTGRKQFLAFTSAFHGRTYGSLSLTNSKPVQRAGFGPFLPVTHVPFPCPYRNVFNEDDEKALTRKTIEFIDSEVFGKTESSEFAAFFLEPIQGEGGYIVPPRDFPRELQKLCNENEILLVVDEIQSGCFRTGKLWAHEHFNVKPDVMCVSKAIGGGLPLGVTVANKKVMDWPKGAHSNTFGGEALAL